MTPIKPARESEDSFHAALTSARRLLVLGRDAEALDAFVTASREPDCDVAALYEGCAQALRNRGQIDEAMTMLDSGLASFPGHASLRFIRSLLLLGQGRYREGWPEYEMRLKTPMRCYSPRAVNWPRWNGERPAGSRLLIWSEQGFGDEIMFASLIPNLSDFYKITFECSRDTAPLFRRSLPNVRVFPVELNGAMPEALAGGTFDFECPLGSLPLALDMEVPHNPRAWLKTDPQLTADLRTDLEIEAAGRLIVGVSWRGGTQMTRGVARSLSLPDLSPILRHNDKVLFVAVQHDMTLAEIQSVQQKIASFPHLMKNLDTLAAVIGACDEIVTVCSTVVHLAGSQGKTVYCLAPHVPEWRYQFSGDVMPWYWDVQVFRQKKYGDWKSVIAEVAKGLADHASKR